MRHYASLAAALCVPLFFATHASAEEAADRVAINRAIGALNESTNDPSQPAALFTADGDAASELALLRRTNPPFRIAEPSERPAPGLTVVISKEPWGEARIGFPAIEPPAVRPFITFVTPDVALAEGAFSYLNGTPTAQPTPLLFVMKREGGGWKIASLRVMAPR